APSVWMKQLLNEFVGTHRGRHRRPIRSEILVDDAEDASKTQRAIKVLHLDVVLEVFGQVLSVLNDPAVEIDDVERSVRPRIEVDGPKAFIGGGQEFGLLICIVGGECTAPLPADGEPPHQIPRRLAHEHIVDEIGGQPIPTKYDRRAGRSKTSQAAILPEDRIPVPTVHTGIRAGRPYLPVDS